MIFVDFVYSLFFAQIKHFAEDLMSSINMLLKVEKEKEKEFCRFLNISNTVIHKIEYATINWSCSKIKYKQIICVLVDRVFANGLRDLGSIPGRVIPKTLKMVLDTSLLNTWQYKVHIKGKVEQYRERSCAIPYSSV